MVSLRGSSLTSSPSAPRRTLPLLGPTTSNTQTESRTSFSSTLISSAPLNAGRASASGIADRRVEKTDACEDGWKRTQTWRMGSAGAALVEAAGGGGSGRQRT